MRGEDLVQGLEVETDGEGVELLRVELVVEELPGRYVVGDLFLIGDPLQLIVDVQPLVDACRVFIDGHLRTHI
jgi:hypothetical protein